MKTIYSFANPYFGGFYFTTDPTVCLELEWDSPPERVLILDSRGRYRPSLFGKEDVKLEVDRYGRFRSFATEADAFLWLIGDSP